MTKWQFANQVKRTGCDLQQRGFFNVEMQISLHPGLLPRLVFYAAEVYTDQLSEGDDNTQLNTKISIYLLTKNFLSIPATPPI